MEPQQITPTIPSQPVELPPSRSNKMPKILLLVFLLLLLGATLVFGYQFVQKKPQDDLLVSPLEPTPITSVSTPTPSSFVKEGTAKNNDVFTVGSLQLQIPENWSYTQTKNPNFGDDWFQINPPGSTDYPIFTLRVFDEYGAGTLEGVQQEVIKTHYLAKPQIKPLSISSVKGYSIVGLPTPPSGPDITCGECYLQPFFKVGDRAKFAVFYNKRAYIFLGAVQDYEAEFDQILSSFRFVDTSSSPVNWKNYRQEELKLSYALPSNNGWRARSDTTGPACNLLLDESTGDYSICVQKFANLKGLSSRNFFCDQIIYAGRATEEDISSCLSRQTITETSMGNKSGLMIDYVDESFASGRYWIIGEGESIIFVSAHSRSYPNPTPTNPSWETLKTQIVNTFNFD